MTRNQLVLKHLDLPKRLAKILTKQMPFLRGEYDDLISVGNLALIQAAKLADPKHPYLVHYLKMRIEGAMKDWLAKGYPHHRNVHDGEMDQVWDGLANPSLVEVADQLNWFSATEVMFIYRHFLCGVHMKDLTKEFKLNFNLLGKMRKRILEKIA